MRHVVITGASSGLGAGMARLFANEGCRLTLFGRDSDRLNHVVSACRAPGRILNAIACDVTDGAAMDRALLTADSTSTVDLVIANAGIGGRSVLAPAAGESAELARAIFDVNMLGVVNTATPLLERFVARRKGHIVLISSIAAFQGVAEAPVYSASKAAVRVYGQGLRRLLAPHGVFVTVVCPGFIATPMSASLPFGTPFSWSAERAAARIAKAISRRAGEVVFPWQLRALATAAHLLPASIVDRLLALGRDWTEQRP